MAGTVTEVENASAIRRSPFRGNPQLGRRGASTRRRLLDCGLEAFAANGYGATTVETITEVAGCSRSAFYQYFSGKEDLFWELANEFGRSIKKMAGVVGEIHADRDGVEAIHRWLDEMVDLTIAHHAVMNGFQAAVRDRPEHGIALRPIGGLGEAIVARARTRPELADDRPLSSVLVGVLARTIHYWDTGLTGLDRAHFIDALACTIHRLLHGSSAGVNDGTPTPVPRPQVAWPESPDSRSSRVPAQARGRRTRASLLDATRVVLPRLGHQETRVDDIVEEAEVSHGAFYRYFDSKDDIVRVVAGEAAAELIDHVGDFPTPTDAATRAWTQHWFRSYRDHGGVISAWQELDRDDPDMTGYSLSIAAVVFDRLAQVLDRRGFGDSIADAAFLLAVLERVPYLSVVLGVIEEDDAVDAVVSLVRYGLFGLPSGPSA